MPIKHRFTKDTTNSHSEKVFKDAGTEPHNKGQSCKIQDITQTLCLGTTVSDPFSFDCPSDNLVRFFM